MNAKERFIVLIKHNRDIDALCFLKPFIVDSGVSTDRFEYIMHICKTRNQKGIQTVLSLNDWINNRKGMNWENAFRGEDLIDNLYNVCSIVKQRLIEK